MSQHELPPRLVIWVIERVTPSDLREGVVGDVTEAYLADRARGTSRFAASLTAWREALSLVRLPRAAFAPQQNSEPFATRDVMRDSIRSLSRSPSFVFASVAVMGVAFAAAAIIAAVAAPVLIEPMPYPQSDHLAMVWARDDKGQPDNIGYATFVDLVAQSRSIARAALIGGWQPVVGEGGEPERLVGERVSWTYFSTLGVHPAIGHDFAATDDQPGHTQVVMLSDALWRERFGADPRVVDRTILLNGLRYNVAGVMPASFDNVLGSQARIWRPLGYTLDLPYACRTCHHLRMVARIRADVSMDAAQRELDVVGAHIVAAHPTDYSGASRRMVVPIGEAVSVQVASTLRTLALAVALLLSIAIANVTNLALARALRRDNEWAIRAALGAPRRRLVMAVVGEGFALAVGASAIGLVIAFVALPTIVGHLPQGLPRVSAIHLTPMVVGIVALAALVTGVVVGLVPALRVGARPIAASGAGTRVAGDPRHFVRASLVVAECAVALTLAVGTAVLGRSMSKLLAVNPGFEPSHLVAIEMNSMGSAYTSDAPVFSAQERAVEAVRAIPGVVAAGAASQFPMTGNIDRYGVRAQDVTLANPELAPSADRYVVTPAFLSTMKVPLIAGRSFDVSDARDSAAKVAIVSASLVRRVWGAVPPASVIGRRVSIGDPTWRTVVGVVGDVRHTGLDDAVAQQIYVPSREWPADNSVVIVARTTGDPAAVAPAIRSAVHAIDRTQPITLLSTVDALVSSSAAQRALALALFAIFAVSAIVLSAAGVYAVLATSVVERTREIGIRAALGATPSRIVRLVVVSGARLAALGGILGLVGGALLTRGLRSLVFGVSPMDPLSMMIAMAGLFAAALVACAIPALRASRVDPTRALANH